MKAAVYTKAKSGKVLEIKDLPQPVPQENEVLLSVRAASVNPLDWRMKAERPGIDVAGEVVAVGRRVAHFKPGDAVFGAGKGAFAEYVCASEAKLAAKPAGVTFEQAASLPIAALTALQALRDKGRLLPQQKVLINGASGGVGTFAVQMAKWMGAKVTGVCSSKNVDLVRSLGADRVIDYTREDFTRDSERYDLLLDNVGNRSLLSMRRALAANGGCVMAGAPKQMWRLAIRVAKAYAWPPFLRQKFGFFVANINQKDLAALAELVEAGKLTPVIDRCYPLTQIDDAIAYVEAGHARAKVIITIQ